MAWLGWKNPEPARRFGLGQYFLALSIKDDILAPAMIETLPTLRVLFVRGIVPGRLLLGVNQTSECQDRQGQSNNQYNFNYYHFENLQQQRPGGKAWSASQLGEKVKIGSPIDESR